MFFKLLVYLCITFHFDFASFFEHFSILESNFKNLTPYSSNWWSELSPLKWAGVCEYVFELLKLEPDFDNRLQIHYNSFSATYTTDWNAKLVLLQSDEIIPQPIMPCYALHSAVISNSMPINSYMNNDIGLGIFSDYVMVVFKCFYTDLENNLINRYYNLLAIYNKFPFHSLTIVPYWIFKHPLVMSEELTSILNNGIEFDDVIKNIYNNGKTPKSHVLQKTDLQHFIKLCTWVYGQKKYSTIFSVSSNPEDYGHKKPTYEILKIKLYKGIHNTLISTKGKACFGKSPDGSFMSRFKLLPGSKVDRIILAFTESEEENIQLAKPLELVYNLDLKYLSDIPTNSIEKVTSS